MMHTEHSQKVKYFPLKFRLKQIYPNLFKDSTRINYSVPYRTKVRIIITDSDGKIIDRLVSKEQDAGMYEAKFNSGNLPEGIYFYTVIAGHHFETKSIVIKK